MDKGGKMREIKFQYLFKFPDGTIHRLTQTLEQLEQHRYIQYNLEKGCSIVARREYTGLKDKNGKEIYEGDILKHDNCWLATVGFDCGAFYWQAQCYKLEAQDWQDATYRDFEVIGNIYENPELLEKCG